RDLGIFSRGDPREQARDEGLGFGDRLVHLPVACDQRCAAHLVSTSTPGSVLPSTSSSDAPPPVETCAYRCSIPNCVTAATESPPPTIDAGTSTSASATARVPPANGSSSNAPIGPFQNAVLHLRISAA